VWAVRFVDPAARASTGTSKTSIHVWGNIVPAWTNRVEAVASESTLPDVRLGLQKSGGARDVAPDGLRGTIEVSADLVVPGSAARPVASGLDKQTLRDPLTLDFSRVPPGQATLRLSLDLTTAAADRPGTGESVPGTRLSTQVVSIPLTVQSPLGYPTIPGRIDFGVAEGRPDLAAALPVTGPGCVWLPADAALRVATTPDGVTGVGVGAEAATSAQSCLQVADGQSAPLTLHLRADQAGNGAVSGTVPVSIAPLGQPDKARTVDVEFTGDLRKPFQAVNFALTLAVALLLGPGLPLGLLYLVKWLGARIPARGLSAERIPVTVEGDRVLRDGRRFEFHETDFVGQIPIPSGGARRLDVHGVELRTRIGRSPFGSGHVAVVPPEPWICVSSTDPVPHGDRMTARLPLAVHNTWVVLHDPAGPPENAHVLVLVGAEAGVERRSELAATIARELPALLERLRSALGDRERVPVGAAAPGPAAGGGPSYGPVPSYGPTPGYGSPSGSGSAPDYGPPPSYGPPSGSGSAPDYGPPPSYGPPSGSGSAPGYGPPPAYGPGPGSAEDDAATTSTRRDRATAEYGPADRPTGAPAHGPGAGYGSSGPPTAAGPVPRYGPAEPRTDRNRLDEPGARRDPGWWGPPPDPPTDQVDRRQDRPPGRPDPDPRS
jgi:hypothetical protein